MGKFRLVVRFLLVAMLTLATIPASAWWTKGDRYGSCACDDPAGGKYWRSWYYSGDDFNVDLTQTPTRNEYFSVTHPTITSSEPYIEFKIKVNGTWETSYPQTGRRMRIVFFDKLKNWIDIASVNDCSGQNIQWYLSQFNYMPVNVNKDYGVVRLISQEGQLTGLMHSWPAGNVNLVLRYYPSKLAIERGIASLGVELSFRFEGIFDSGYLGLSYKKDVDVKLTQMAQKADFNVVGPYDVEYSVPQASSSIMPTSFDTSKPQFRTVKYNFPFDNGTVVTASQSKAITGAFKRKDITVAEAYDYNVGISENFKYDRMTDRVGGSVVSCNMSNEWAEPNAWCQDVAGESNPKYEVRLKGYPCAASLAALFKKWGTPRVVLDWTSDGKDADGADADTDGKWYVYRAEADENGHRASDYVLVGNVDYEERTYEDRTIASDKRYVYAVMFGANSWKSKYWKATDGYLRELAKESGSVDTKVELAMGGLRHVRSTGDEKGIRISWTSERVEDDNINYVIKRKVGNDGKWNEQYATVSARNNNVSFLDSEARSASVPYYYKVAVTAMGKTFETDELKAYYDLHSSITALKASTGAFSDKVTIEGTIDRQTTDETQYVVQRKLRGSGETEYTTIYTGKTQDTNFTYDDNTAKVGDVYEYCVQLREKDNEQRYITLNEQTAIGFCRSTGVVAGRVTYGSGVAVAGVKVVVTPDANDKVSRTGQYALHAETVSRGIAWQLQPGLFENGKSLTVQFWAKPDEPTSGITPKMFGIGDIFGLYLTPNPADSKSYLLATKAKNGELKTLGTDGDVVRSNEYCHFTLRMTLQADGMMNYELAMIKDGDKEGNTIASSESIGDFVAADTTYTMSFCGTPELDEKVAFKGCVDDIRIWNKLLSVDEDNNNYDRILCGTESGLVAYWPLDENLDNLVFDYSMRNNVANMNNPEVDLSMKSVATTPQSLGSYGLTDDNGNYIVRGIPYSSVGTNYIVRPLYGIHSFSPQHRTSFMTNSTSTASGTDFTDVSSFPVSGSVVYQGTNCPVEGAMVSVDGVLCTKEGRPVQTDEFGHFEISVPIGEHSVSVSKNKHVFVNDGRYPATGLQEYKTSVSGLTFEDATKVVLTGRVTGGNVEGKKPVGFGASLNTIGEAEITLKASDIYYVNAHWNGIRYEAADSISALDSSTPNINSTSYRGKGVDGAHRIYIKTDPYTGEFSALVPPMKYRVENIRVATNSSVTFDDIPKDIDITSVGVEYKDSMLVERQSGDSVMMYYPYQLKMLQTYLDPKPKFIVRQVDKNDSGKYGAFGMRNFEKKGIKFEDLWTWNESKDSVEYALGYPLFRQGETYEFQVEAYDEYVNNDYGEPEYTKVPQSGVKVTVSNPMSSEQTVIGLSKNKDVETGQVYHLKEGQMILDKNGMGTIRWKAGFPNVTSPYTRTINISGEFNGRPQSASSVTGVVLGSLPNGNNFVTQGPDQIVTVLRDPPASASSASLQNDTVTVNEHVDVDYSGFINKTETEMSFGLKFKTIQAFVLVDDQEAKNQLLEEGEVSSKHTTTNTRSVTTTISKTVSTSDNEEYVGSNGDVFIGYSTNVLIGDSRNVTIEKDEDTGGYRLVDKDGMVMDQTFSTAFHFTQLEIETKQIPMWERMRNSMLLRYPKAESKEAAAKVQNGGKLPIYVTWLDPEDEDFGTEGTYLCVAPTEIDTVMCDSVNYMNQQIQLWKSYLAMNEQDKVNAFNDRGGYFIENLSFDGGSSIQRSYASEKTKSTSSLWEYSWEFLGGGKTGFLWNSIGTNIKVMNGRSWGSSTEDVSSTTHSQTVSYNLMDGNSYTDLSVDVYKSPMGWGPIFRTRGGQTVCPWEREERTRYFEPNNSSDSHILNYGTQALDTPKLYCDERTKTDVPAGETAVFKLKLVNQSQASLENSYILKAVDDTNPDGAIISVDGTALNKGLSFAFGVGQTIEKTLTIRQADLSVDKLDRLGIALVSSCQNDPASYFGAIGDTIYLSVNYAPTSSDVVLKVPNTTMNTATGSKMNFTIDGFDRTFKNLYGLRLQYRYGGSTSWTTLREYVLNPADSTSTMQSVIPREGAIVYPADMSNFAVWPDGDYTWRVVSIVRNGNEEVTKSSAEIAFVKDMERPKPLGYPTPKNGILGIGDDISVTFNEDIQRGMLTNNNVVVSGILNEQQLTHGVAAKLSGVPLVSYGDYNLSGTDFTAEMWLYRTSEGEILRHGYGGTMMVASTDGDGHLVVNIDGEKFTSEKTMPKDKWTFLALSVDNTSQHKMNANIAYDTEQLALFENVSIPVYAGRSELVVGNELEGMAHDLTLWNYERTAEESFSEMDKVKSVNTYGLIGYWKFDEGRGTVAKDQMGRNDMYFVKGVGSWYLDNENLAATLDGQTTHVDIPLASISTTERDSYAIEMWFKAVGKDDDSDQTLFQVGTKEDSILSVSFSADGNTIHVVHSKAEDTFGYNAINDNVWHHMAFNVRRGVAARLLIDGRCVATISEKNVPALAAAVLRIGASVSQVRDDNGNILSECYSDFLKGAVDEIKVWNADVTGEYLSERCCLRADGESGLVAYYPFESLRQDEYHQWKASFSLEDMSSNKAKDVAVAGGVAAQTDAPPMKMKGRKTVLDTNFTASERSVFVTINNSLSEYNGTTLDFEVNDVRDYNGNVSQPVKWSAYVDMNSLKWSNGDISIVKKVDEKAKVSVNIVNNGSMVENFYLLNVPKWIGLNADDVYGKVEPQKNKTVELTVSDDIAVGVYDQVIYLGGNNAIYEPLHVRVKVEAQKPDWTVDASGYDKSMNIVAKTYIDGDIVSDGESMLAVFADGKCVGVASPEYNINRDSYFAAVTVYGNKDGEELEFRFCDATTGITYTRLKTSEPVTFKNQNIVGSFASPLLVENCSEYEQVVELNKGWNWTSLFLKPLDDDVNAVLAAVADKINIVKDETDFAMPHANGLVGSLVSLTPKKMYLVSSKENSLFQVYGSLLTREESDVVLNSGWNWFGSTSPKVMSLDEAFTGLNPDNGDVIKSQRAFVIYDGGNWEGNLSQIAPGVGYKYLNRSGEAKTFRFPMAARTNGYKTPMPQMVGTDGYYFKPCDRGKYSDNMTVVAQVRDAAQVVDTLELAAFVSGECRATAFALGENYYLSVPGNAEGGEVVFKTLVDGNVVEFANTIPYRSDDMVGSPDAPYLLDLGNASGVACVPMSANDIVVTPRVVRNSVCVSAGSAIKNVCLYDMRGSLLREVRPEATLAEIELTAFPAGGYIVSVALVNGKHSSERITKQ